MLAISTLAEFTEVRLSSVELTPGRLSSAELVGSAQSAPMVRLERYRPFRNSLGSLVY